MNHQNCSVFCFPTTHNREPYDTLLYCPTSCPYRSVCGTDAACSSNTIRDSTSRVAPSLRRPPCGTRGVRARLRAAGQPSRAGLVLEEVGVRHVERHSRLRSPDELAALHAPLDDGPRHADVRHPADAVACELDVAQAASEHPQPTPAQHSPKRSHLMWPTFRPVLAVSRLEAG